jgi:hypothetical protein
MQEKTSNRRIHLSQNGDLSQINEGHTFAGTQIQHFVDHLLLWQTVTSDISQTSH